MKTQILITNIPTALFEQGWPQKLQKELCCQGCSFIEEKDREILVNNDPSKCVEQGICSFSALKFLNRIIIICSTEDKSLQMYKFLKDKHNSRRERQSDGELKGIQVYLVESLLKSASVNSFFDAKPPVRPPALSVNTSFSVTSVPQIFGRSGSFSGSDGDSEGAGLRNENCLSVGCGSTDGCLSPASIGYSPYMPRKIKRRDTGEFVYYKEPMSIKKPETPLEHTPENGLLKCSPSECSIVSGHSIRRGSSPAIVITDGN